MYLNTNKQKEKNPNYKKLFSDTNPNPNNRMKKQYPQIRNDQQFSLCFNPQYCVEWTIPSSDQLTNPSGQPLPNLIDKFQLPEYDECISMHSCAITKKIPLNGNLYIYNSKICFFSQYNSETLIGKATVLSIPCSDIDSVSKKKTGFIFDQAIDIILKNGQNLFLSAFKERDNAYNYISELLTWQKKLQPTQEDLNIECIRQELQQIKESEQEISSNKNNNQNQDIIQLSDDEDNIDQQDWEEINTAEEMERKKNQDIQWNQHTDKLTILYQTRLNKLRNIVFNHDEIKTKAKWTSIDIPNISTKEIFILFFGNNLFEDENQQKHSNFQMYYNTKVLSEQNMQYTEITPEPPVYFSNLYENNKLEIVDFSDYSTRKCTFTHPIKEAFMPKSCECFLSEKIYWVSPKEILIERELTLTGLPLSNHFTPHVVYQITESADSTYTTIKSGYYIHYIKDTWFKSKIDKTSDEENMKNWKKISELYIKYSQLWITRREQGQQLQKKQINNSQINNIIKKDNNIQLQQLNASDISNNDSSELEIIQSQNNNNSNDDNQIASIADATQSICNIF